MKIVAVTACPLGVAHTYLAAEALENAAKKEGIDIKVETQGSIGIENQLTKEDIEAADIVVLTKDMEIKHFDRFKGKKIVEISVGDAIKKAGSLIKKFKKIVEE